MTPGGGVADITPLGHHVDLRPVGWDRVVIPGRGDADMTPLGRDADMSPVAGNEVMTPGGGDANMTPPPGTRCCCDPGLARCRYDPTGGTCR